MKSIAALALAFFSCAAASSEAAAAAARAPLILRSSANPPVRNASTIPAGIYRLDQARSRLTARITRAGQAPVLLRFTRFEAMLVYDPARPEAARAEVMLDPASFSTGGAARSGYAGAVAKWRAFSFVSTSFQRTTPTRGVLTGNVSFFGFVRPLAIQLTLTSVLPGENPVLGFSGSSAVSIANPSMIAFTGLQLGGDVQLAIEAQFVKA